ncbi:MAG: nucleoside recognition domain-containing protein [Candidatus Margulisiibacteriota bacterium]|nr:nucleoside recognition domain-containing protein [Candidatus Margulisiibacteriota bacterium]
MTGAGPIIVGITIILWVLATIEVNSQPLINFIGQLIEPIFKPMGVDWRVGVALILSFAAREVFVSALAVVFKLSEASLFDLSNLSNLTFSSTGEPIFTTGSIIGLILFFMVAMQCGATLAVLKKEMQGFKVPLILLILYILIAYVLAIIANSIF